MTKLLRNSLLLSLAVCVCSYAQELSVPSYRADQTDFDALQDGISSALSVEKDLFAHGVGSTGIVLYDSENLFIYSRHNDLSLPKRGAWREYTIYQIPHNSAVSERAMARCAGGEDFVWEILSGKVPAPYFTCSPWTIQKEIQRRRRSIYDTRESYLATVVHEYGHVYMSQELWQIPIVQKMIPRVQSLQSRASRESILMEAYAIWCELQASKKLFPSHYGKLKNMYVPGDDERHNLGLKVARDLMDEAHPAAVSPTILQLLQTTEINRLFR